LVSQAEARGEQRGERRGQVSLMLSMLSTRFGEVPDSLTTQIAALSLEQIAALSKTFFNFNSLGDLRNWLRSLSQNQDDGSVRE